MISAEVLQRYDKAGPRYTSYPTAVEFHTSYGEAHYIAALQEAAQVHAPLSLYTHLPFCSERCLYCACNVIITAHREIAAAYLDRLKQEVATVASYLGARRSVSQLHLGGGTPTYYTPEQLDDLLSFYKDFFELEEGAEVAIEVDPRVTTAEHLTMLADQGFNRLSLGVQDFNPLVQETVNRVQSVAETGSLMEQARALGFYSINIDLIYGLPHQTVSTFTRTLEQVIDLKPDRLAVYSFALVPWMKGHQKQLPQEALPQGLAKFELLASARSQLLDAGYIDIGMDHFALPDDELTRAQRERRLGRNFMGYTTSRAPDLIGFGISSIGAVSGTFSQNAKKLSRYNDAVDQGRLPVERGYLLEPDDRIRQHVIQEWMCNFMVDKRAVEQRFGLSFDAYFAPELDELQALEAEGLILQDTHEVRATDLGRLFPRNVAMVFDRHLRTKTRDRPLYSRTV